MVFGVRSIGVFSQFFVGSLLITTIVVHDIDACVLNVDSSTVACSAEKSGKSKGVDSNLGKGIDVNNKVVEGVNTCKAYGSNPESFDVECTMYSRDVNLEDAWRYQNIGSDAHQIVDVQGRLKQKLSFWKDILHAPPPILDWVDCAFEVPTTPICTKQS